MGNNEEEIKIILESKYKFLLIMKILIAIVSEPIANIINEIYPIIPVSDKSSKCN